MKLATEDEIPALENFLKAHIETSMFPLSSLRRFGLSGGHPRAARFWMRWKDGMVTDALALSEEGFLFPQCPTGGWQDVAVVLRGEKVKGILGDSGQSTAMRAAIGLSARAEMDDVDPLYTVNLADLVMPDVQGYELSPITPALRETAIRWRASFLREVMPVPGEDLDERAEGEIDAYMAADSHRVLLKDGMPLAMTGFNAQLEEAVQVGGVYTPDSLRGNGYARRAVAMHLAEARDQGVGRSILFAASEQAGKVYEAIGFRREGAFALTMYETPQVIHV